jgi:excisionase family DNA binding protein
MDKPQNAKSEGTLNGQCPWIRADHDHELMDEREAAAYLGMSRSGLRKWRARRRGPAYARLGKIIRYRKSDLDAFVQSGLIAYESSEHQ